jgi:hypothetical protein
LLAFSVHFANRIIHFGDGPLRELRSASIIVENGHGQRETASNQLDCDTNRALHQRAHAA